MFIWAEIPEKFKAMGSQAFAQKLLLEADTVVSAGVGFGEYGEGYVRFALIENEDRTRQAIRNIKKLLENS